MSLSDDDDDYNDDDDDDDWLSTTRNHCSTCRRRYRCSVEAPPSPAPAASLAAPWHIHMKVRRLSSFVGHQSLAVQGFGLNWWHQTGKLKTLSVKMLFCMTQG